VRVVFKHNPLPFHKNAMPAAEAAMAADAQGKFWEMEKKLFENQRALERADLERYAQELHLDVNRFKADLDGHTHQRRIEADQRLAQQIGARGTPAFFINGRNVRGALPYEEFKRVIDEEITRADRVLKTGVPRSRLYAELTKDGRTSAAPPGKAPPTAGQQPPRQREDPTAVYKVPIDGGLVKGPPTALVTIVEFTDFQ
jgi:protein-disulfide isomerase